MAPEHHNPSQLSFLSPEDAQVLDLLQRLVAEAARLYEVRTGRPLNERPVIDGPRTVYDLLAPQMAHLAQEQVRTLNLNTRNRVYTGLKLTLSPFKK